MSKLPGISQVNWVSARVATKWERINSFWLEALLHNIVQLQPPQKPKLRWWLCCNRRESLLLKLEAFYLPKYKRNCKSNLIKCSAYQLSSSTLYKL